MTIANKARPRGHAGASRWRSARGKGQQDGRRAWLVSFAGATGGGQTPGRRRVPSSIVIRLWHGRPARDPGTRSTGRWRVGRRQAPRGHGLGTQVLGQLRSRHRREAARMRWLMPADPVPRAGPLALVFAWPRRRLTHTGAVTGTACGPNAMTRLPTARSRSTISKPATG
jgi:hypothetical protein